MLLLLLLLLGDAGFPVDRRILNPGPDERKKNATESKSPRSDHARLPQFLNHSPIGAANGRQGKLMTTHTSHTLTPLAAARRRDNRFLRHSHLANRSNASFWYHGIRSTAMGFFCTTAFVVQQSSRGSYVRNSLCWTWVVLE